jgi:hypothetical protein
MADAAGQNPPRTDWGGRKLTAPYQPPAPAGGQPQNTLGLISMIVGIISIPLGCCFGSGLLFGAGAIVLSILGKQKVQQGLANNEGQVKAGLITGIVGAGLSLLWVLLWITGAGLSMLPGIS